MAGRPALPKRLAARVRAAQQKVLEARGSIYGAEFNRQQLGPRLAEYKADPYAFAAKYYGQNGPDSYPVQTNIARTREKLERAEWRQPERIAELAAAEANLQAVEEQVYEEVMAMRPTTGRVPWPRRLPAFGNYKDQVAKELEKQRIEYERYKEKLEADYTREMQAIDDQRDREDEREAARERKRWEKLTPAQREKEEADDAFFKEAIRSGALTVHDILDYMRKD